MGANMAGQQIDFASLAWDGWNSETLARVKAAEADGYEMRLFELGPSFVEPQWCTRGHVGYVVSGQYITDLDDGTLQMRAGQGFVLPPGVRHRSRNTGAMPAIVFLVDLDAPALTAAKPEVKSQAKGAR
jgi:quercetin dioxygenase-like cupin family protein